ncbi:Putative nucleoside-triphosphatase [Neorhizobium galegae bv. orientalis]|nr:Putative nucleoside-triphosphatase [Neorhizobium galegae bv. orientalis]
MTRKPRLQAGEKGVRAHFLDALQVLEEQKTLADPDPNTPREGIKAGQWPGAPHDAMPPGCPITVLGKKGETIYVIDAIGEMQEVTRWDLPTLARLFSPHLNYLMWAWPAFGKSEGTNEDGEPNPPKVKRVERDKAAMAIIAEAGRKGLFDPQQNVRGRGGWKAQDRFIWHSGKYLFTVDVKADGQNKATGWNLQATKPGEYDGFFYAQDADTIQPWQQHIGIEDSPAHQLLQDLQSWNWERPYIDPIFLLGWIGSAMLSGALDVRPILFTTGGAGVGKSTLHGIIQALFGPALYHTANTTAAGIYQNIRQDSRPVAVDEFERKANSTKETPIVELARQSYSGAKGYRGGANGEGTEFELRSSFMFSAIMPPVLGVQDRTRMIILNLKALDKSRTTAQPVISDVAGRMLLRQMMDGFHDFYWHILPKWKTRLADKRLPFDARAIDTYGTVLACAELLVGEQGMIDAGMHEDPFITGRLNIDMLIETLDAATAAERADQVPQWQIVIEKVLGAKLDSYKGGDKLTVGGVIEQLEEKVMTIEDARRLLALMGLGMREQGSPGVGYSLAIPHGDDNLDRLFADSDFHKGGWTLALRQAPETVVPRDLTKALKTVKINRLPKTVTLVDLKGYDAWMERE